LASATPAVTAATATFTDVFPAASPPIPGPNDIYQTNYQGETNSNLGINYYTDNTATPGGTTFVTGSNPGGYLVTNVFVQPNPTGFGNGGSPSGPPTASQPYEISFYQISGSGAPGALGSNATLVAHIITSPGAITTVGDWLSFSNFTLLLSPNTTNAFTWGRLSTGTGYMGLPLVTNSTGTWPGRFAGGLPCIISAAGGNNSVGYGAGTVVNGVQKTNYDTVFSIGIRTNFFPASITATNPFPGDQLVAGSTATFTSTGQGSLPCSGYWQVNRNDGNGWVTLHNGGNISGATTVSSAGAQAGTLVVSNVCATNVGSYQLVVTNSPDGVTLDSATSSVVTLTLASAPANSFAAAALTPGYGAVALWPLNETNDPSTGMAVAYDIVGGFNGIYGTNAQDGATNSQLPAVLKATGLSAMDNISPVPGPASAGLLGLPGTAFASINNLANSIITVPQGPSLPGVNSPAGVAVPNSTNMSIVLWYDWLPLNTTANTYAWNYCILFDECNGTTTSLTAGENGAQIDSTGTGGGLGYCWDNNSSSTYSYVIPNQTVAQNQWTMYALTISPSNAVIYMGIPGNGLVMGTNTARANVNVPWGGALQIGGSSEPNAYNNSSGPNENFFNGAISSAAMFTNTLSLAQIQALFNAGQAQGAPAIVNQPVSTAVYAGCPAQFAVTAVGNPPLYYNWQRSGTNLVDQGNVSGSTTATLTITNVSTADTNNYDVVVTNNYGAITSSVAALTLNPTPRILSQPMSLAVGIGQAAQFTVGATAIEPLSYQWEAGASGSGVYTNLTDGGNISGSTSQTLTISDPGEWNQADYLVVISDAAGEVISRAATLTVGTWEEAGEAGAVTAVAASPDGAWIASGSDDATVKIWRASDGGLERTLAAGGLLQVTALAFGPGGTNIAAGYYDGSIRLWNTANGALVSTFTKCYGKVASLAFSPNGQQLAIGCGDWITRILRLSDGTVLNNGGSGSILNYGVVRSVAYSPDGSKLAVAGEDTNLIKKIVVLNSSTWATLATLNQGYNNTNLVSSNSVTSLAFSPDGATLASGCLDQTICLWRTSGWGLNGTMTNTGPGITALAFAPNGQTLFSGDQSGNITAWAASAGWSSAQSWSGHTNTVWSLACIANTTLLVSGGDDSQVKIWQSTDGALATNLTSHSAMITRACFAPDGSMVATAGNDGSLRLWAAQSGAPAYILIGHTNQVSALAFSPDATFLVSGGGCLDNDLCVWSCSSGAWLQTIPGLFTNGVTALAVSPDTSLIASAGDRTDQVIKLWNRTNGGLLYTVAGHSSGTAALAFSPNGQYLASGGMFTSGAIKLWDLRSGNCAATYTGHACTVVSISFNPTGTLLASAGQTDGLINIWTNGSVTPVCSLTSLSAGARAVAFSPDGTLLAAAGSDTIQMWQTSNWQPVWSCTNETVGISALSFSPNGAFLVFGRDDGTAGRMWNPLAAPVQLWLGATQAGRFTIANPSYSPYLTVQTSSDLAHWNALTNLVAATNLVQVVDPSLSPPPIRFYRVTTPQ